MSTQARLWTGRIIKAVVVLFLLFDGTIHILNIAPVIAASTQLGFPVALAPVLGAIELGGVVLFVVPSTAALGTVLLTAYLGGATAAQVRVGGPYPFAIGMGLLVWVSACLLDPQLFQAVTPGSRRGRPD